MDILFDDDDLERLCSEERVMKKRLGSQGAKKLRRRLADLAATSRVSDLVAGDPHPYTGDKKGLYSLDLDGGRRLLFEPSDDPPPTKPDGGIDWSQVTSIVIVFVGDPHD